MKKFPHSITKHPNTKCFTDSVANVLYSMYSTNARVWPTTKATSRKKNDLRSRKDISFLDVPLAQAPPSSVYPFAPGRARGGRQNKSPFQKENTFYQSLQGNKDRESWYRSKGYQHTHQELPLMPVHQPIQYGMDMRNMSNARGLLDGDKPNTEIYDLFENNQFIQRVEPPVIESANVPTTCNAQKYILSFSTKVESNGEILRRHKKGAGNQKQKKRKQSRLSNRRKRYLDSVSVSSTKSTQNDASSIILEVLREIEMAEKHKALVGHGSSVVVRPCEQQLLENQDEDIELRRSNIRMNSIRSELFMKDENLDSHKNEETPGVSPNEENVNKLKEFLSSNSSTHFYGNEIDMDKIVPTVLHYPYSMSMMDENVPAKVDPSVPKKRKIRSKPKLEAPKAIQPPLEKKENDPKKIECCICQAMHRNQTKDAPFIVEMKREQKRQELLAYRIKMSAADPSISGGVWCKQLDNCDQIIHQKVSQRRLKCFTKT